jgi:hypothetical protein
MYSGEKGFEPLTFGAKNTCQFKAYLTFILSSRLPVLG